MVYTWLWGVGRGRSGWSQERMGYLGLYSIKSLFCAVNIDLGVLGINVIDAMGID